MKKAVQYFSDEYLEHCRKMTTDQILEFLEDFRNLHSQVDTPRKKSKLISLKVPEDLLQSFKTRSEAEGISYQTQIKNLMREWLLNNKET